MARRHGLGTVAALLLAGTALPASAQDPAPDAPTGPVYIHAGRLLAEPGEAPRGPSTIIVRGGEVAEVRDGLAPPEAGAELVDLSDARMSTS
jgi:hypothetical protein